MSQPRLWDEGGYTPARQTDPVTSQEGADHVKKTAAHLRRAMYLAFAAGPKTAMEAAREAQTVYGGSIESLRKRSGELKRDNRIRVVRLDGQPYRRPCRVTGCNAEVLEVVR